MNQNELPVVEQMRQELHKLIDNYFDNANRRLLRVQEQRQTQTLKIASHEPNVPKTSEVQPERSSPATTTNVDPELLQFFHGLNRN